MISSQFIKHTGTLISKALMVILFFCLVQVDGLSSDYPIITQIEYVPETQFIQLNTTGGTFDPILKYQEPASGVHQITIKGKNIILSPELQHEVIEIAKVSSDIQTIHLFQSFEKDIPVIQVTFTLLEKRQPQIKAHKILANQKSQIAISLIDPQKNIPEKIRTNPGPKTFSKEQSHYLSIYQIVEYPDTDPLILYAWKAYRNGNFADASNHLKQLFEKHPKSHWGYYLKALVALSLEKEDASIEALQKALKEKEFLSGRLLLIQLYFSQGHGNKAQEWIQKTVEYYPNHPTVHYLKGLLEESQGNWAEARLNYLKALSLDPDHPSYRYRLAMVSLKDEKYALAKQELELLTLFVPDYSDGLKALGFLYEKEQKPLQANHHYRKSIKPDALINYGHLLSQEKNKKDQALTLYKAAEIVAGENLDIWYNLGMLYLNLEEPRLAAKSLSTFLDSTQLSPEDKRITEAKNALKQIQTIQQKKKKSTIAPIKIRPIIKQKSN